MTDETVRRLQALDDEYTAAVNTAIAEDRMDLVQRLADEYPEAAAEVMDASVLLERRGDVFLFVSSIISILCWS